MDIDKKSLKFARTAFDMLKTDPASAVFAEEILDKKLLLKIKKSKYKDGKIFFKVVNNLLLNNNEPIFKPEIVNRSDYIEKREIDHSTLYSFDGPFQLVHADVANLEFLGKNLFSSKTYTYRMKSRKQIRQRLEEFYRDVADKRKGKKMRLQVDQEFQQVKIKDLNDLNNVHMFSTFIRDGKAFAAEQKIRELKTRTAKVASQKLKISPNKIIEISMTNSNIQPNKKYGISPEEIEKKALQSEQFRTVYNIHRLEKTDKLNERQDKYDKEKYKRKRKKLRANQV